MGERRRRLVRTMRSAWRARHSDESTVFPFFGADEHPPRMFNFTAHDYDDSAWADPVDPLGGVSITTTGCGDTTFWSSSLPVAVAHLEGAPAAVWLGDSFDLYPDFCWRCDAVPADDDLGLCTECWAVLTCP